MFQDTLAEDPTHYLVASAVAAPGEVGFQFDAILSVINILMQLGLALDLFGCGEFEVEHMEVHEDALLDDDGDENKCLSDLDIDLELLLISTLSQCGRSYFQTHL